MSGASFRPRAVVDASVWVGYLVEDDANHAASERWLNTWLQIDHGLVVPGLAAIEVAGAVSRRTGSVDVGLRAASWVKELPTLVTVDFAADLADDAARFAASLHLRGADAVYVALAVLPLVTWDKELLDRAARHVDVRTPSGM